jgi:hypothetical protein
VHSCLSPIHTASAERERGSSGARGDRRLPTSCTAAPADARYVSGPRLTPLGRSSTICRPCSEAAAASNFAKVSLTQPKDNCRHASARRHQRDGIDGVAVSIGLVTAPRAARQRPIWSHGTAPVTPRLGAPRPPSREHTPAHRSGGAATTPQCWPARVRPLKHLLLRPSNRRADLQPLRALPPRATSSALQTVRQRLRLTRASRAPGFRFFATVKGLTNGICKI